MLKAPWRVSQEPDYVLCRGDEADWAGRWWNLVCPCLPKWGKCWRGLRPGLVLFMLVTPPLQAGVVGPYPVRGAWFSSHVPLEGTGRIQVLGRNRWHVVPQGTRPRHHPILQWHLKFDLKTLAFHSSQFVNESRALSPSEPHFSSR
jgi:hypothetical protein